jgi:hypothetical protein
VIFGVRALVAPLIAVTVLHGRGTALATEEFLEEDAD